jgi:ribosomal protein S18 acetylase RimI-like enzyme
VTIARVQDEAPLARTLTRAFLDDPVPEWICPDERLRERMLTRFYRRLFGCAMRHQEVYTTADCTGAAIWLPPGHERLGLADQLSLMRSLAYARLLASIPRVVAGLARADRAHPRQPPHWYLMVLGVDPASQGRGHGSRLLAPVLERCDADDVCAYLESSKESNISFYARHGFRVTDEVELPLGPVVYGMWREPR